MSTKFSPGHLREGQWTLSSRTLLRLTLSGRAHEIPTNGSEFYRFVTSPTVRRLCCRPVCAQSQQRQSQQLATKFRGAQNDERKWTERWKERERERERVRSTSTPDRSLSSRSARLRRSPVTELTAFARIIPNARSFAFDPKKLNYFCGSESGEILIYRSQGALLQIRFQS